MEVLGKTVIMCNHAEADGQRPKSVDIRQFHLELAHVPASRFHSSVVSSACRPNVAAGVSYVEHS